MSPIRFANASIPDNNRVPHALRIWGHGVGILLLTAVLVPTLHPQAVTIGKDGRIKDGTNSTSESTVDRRFTQVEPTHVALGGTQLDPKTRLELIRVLDSEQGFAMRPLPRGHKGLTLVANGKVEPAGEAWLNMATENGLCAKPGDRVVLTDVKIDHNHIVFLINGGPDAKHRIMRHIEVGGMGGMTPVVQDNGEEPTGARLTLAFEKPLPELTGTEVKALLAPLITFDVKTPVQAFTDTLPPSLKDAILSHHILVGMSTEMVLYAVGSPQSKTRETVDQMPFEEWIYGTPPKPVEFVRINGNRVIRLEIAKVGEQPEIFEKDVVSGLMRTDGAPLMPSNTRTVSMGDTTYNPDTQAAPAPPSLKNPGEKLPNDPTKAKDRETEMGPVQFPKPNPADDPPVAHHPPPTSAPSTAQPAPSTPPAQSTQPAPTPAPQPSAPASQSAPPPQTAQPNQ